MKITFPGALACMLLLLLGACGGGDKAEAERPTLTASVIEQSSAPVSPEAYRDIVQRIYVAYFGRPADPAGLEFWAGHVQSRSLPVSVANLSSSYGGNSTVREFVDAFGHSAESTALYPGDNTAFVTAIYRNLFNREPDAPGLAYWVDVLDRGIMSRPIAALYIMGGAQFSDVIIVDKKIEIARQFTTALNTDALRLAYSGMAPSERARQMLSTVGLDTDTTTFTGVTDLINEWNTQTNTSPLSAYLGTWTAACDQHESSSIYVTDMPGQEAVVIWIRTDYYALPTCEGQLLATETMSAGIIAVHGGRINSSIVFAEGSPAVPATVDTFSMTLPAHTTSVVGPGVVHTIKDGQAQWCIDYGGGAWTCIMDDGPAPAEGPLSAGMSISGNQLHLLVPVGSLYFVEQTYTRR